MDLMVKIIDEIRKLGQSILIVPVDTSDSQSDPIAATSSSLSPILISAPCESSMNFQ
ncbi:hypothetical protein DSO57_1011033 [Entomophthora muscae]|uniref:Uncharacterized protein n=1 Tax=Entomophthora muscae TaxID=34485 RepID=A0ACC2S8X2_9FUNG|nr:hypothetical protein DSO57_1011033 [Entomophthora muscae]